MGYIDEVNVMIEGQEKLISTGLLMEKLKKNREFDKLFIKYFTNERCVELVQLKTDCSRQDPVSQAWIDNELMGISYVSRFISDTIDMGIRAAQALKNTQHEKDEYLNSPEEEDY